MKTKNLFLTIILAVAGLLAARPAFTQPLVLTGTSYFQNFDGIGSGLPQGWNTYSTASSTGLGSLSAFHTATTSWANTSALFWNFASLTNNDGTVLASTASSTVQAAVLNRVMGVRQTGTANTGGDPGAAFVLELNDTTIGSGFTLSFDWLMLNDQTRTTVWRLDYGIGSNPTAFIPVGSWTNGGFLPFQYSTSYFGTTNLSFSFGTALDNQTQPVWIRIVTVAGTTGSGSRNSFGLDNFNLSWGPPITTTTPVSITTQPQSQTNNAGTTATFTVVAAGTTPVVQWYEMVGGNPVQLSDGGNADGSQISGSGSPVLQISGLFGAESGSYFANVSNSANSINSALATLTVIDPFISEQPLNQTNASGDISYFDATAIGSQPMDVQWYYDGALIQDTLTNGYTNQVFVYVTNSPAWTNPAGFYMVAANSYGTVTSAVVTASLPTLPSTMLARWDFNSTGSYPVTAPLTSIGVGTGAAVTGTYYDNFLFVPGAIADPIDLNASFVNSGWEFQDGPTNGTANKQVGFQYNTSTVGYNNIVLTWEERHSATASKYMRVQYSTDGMNFTDGPVITFNVVAYEFCSANLSGIPGINNNPNFAFRIVSEFESTAIGTANANYDGTAGSYGPGSSGGTIRNDLTTVWGSPQLNIALSGNNVVLTWSAPGFSLQSAPAATGTYSTINGATSPYTTAITGSQKYFRLTPN